MQTGHPKHQRVKLCLHTAHDRDCSWNKKVQDVSSYYLIAVHEEADDECAHAQLIVDTILLRYRGTSLTTSSETTLALPKTESWVAAWIDFLLSVYSELLLHVGNADGEQFAREDRSSWEGYSSGK
jgi:hypothetical protein